MGVRARIEMAVRRLARRRGELFIVTCPAFSGQHVASVGPDSVLVPSSTWKAVYDPSAGASGAYVCTNTATRRCAVVSVADLVRAVGVDPFPALPGPAGHAQEPSRSTAPLRGGPAS